MMTGAAPTTELVPAGGQVTDLVRERKRREHAERRAARQARIEQLARIGSWVLVIIVAASIAMFTINLNNRVIERSVELGKLEDARRALRTDNALLGAELARLSAPNRVMTEARQRLDMVPATEMPRFIYLDPATVREQRERQRQLGAVQAAEANSVDRGLAVATGEMFLGASRALDGGVARPILVSDTTGTNVIEDGP